MLVLTQTCTLTTLTRPCFLCSVLRFNQTLVISESAGEHYTSGAALTQHPLAASPSPAAPLHSQPNPAARLNPHQDPHRGPPSSAAQLNLPHAPLGPAGELNPPQGPPSLESRPAQLAARTNNSRRSRGPGDAWLRAYFSPYRGQST